MDLRQRLLADMPVEERRVDLVGIPTAVLEGGDGPPVVLLHGPGACAAHWTEVIPGLVATHRVIAPDLPGHGASGTGDGPVSAERILEWLGALIERTCSSPPAVVGHLLGGAVAARFGAREGERVDQLALVDTFGLTDLALPADFGQALAQYLAEPSAGTHESLWRYCAFDLPALRERMGDRWYTFTAYNVDRARGPDMRRALHVMLEELTPAIPAAELERIDAPVTLIWGRHDLAVRRRGSARPTWMAAARHRRRGRRCARGAAAGIPARAPGRPRFVISERQGAHL